MESRLFLVIVGLLGVAISCTKSNDSTTPSVTFLANGKVYTMVPPKIILFYSGTSWLICGDKNGDSITLQTGAFKIRTGTFPGDCKSYFSSIHYECSNTLSGSTVTFSNIHDSLVDGTFSAPNQVQTIPAGTGKMSITQGTFKNIPWY
jgi:hypothetical protein